MNLHTIGYEGLDLDTFASLIETNGVCRIIDVRELPISRKPGFSKSKLNGFLRSMGIEYFHIPALGCPKAIRHEYREDKNWQKYTTRYLIHLSSLDNDLDNLLKMVENVQSCLLCFEADHMKCHRSFIADQISVLSDGEIHVHPIELPKSSAVEWLPPFYI